MLSIHTKIKMLHCLQTDTQIQKQQQRVKSALYFISFSFPVFCKISSSVLTEGAFVQVSMKTMRSV